MSGSPHDLIYLYLPAKGSISTDIHIHVKVSAYEYDGDTIQSPADGKRKPLPKKEHFEQLPGRCEGKRTRGSGERESQAEGMARAKAQLWERAGLKEDIYSQGLQGGGMGVYCIMGAKFQHGGNKFWKQKVVIAAHIVNAVNAPGLHSD